MNTGTLHVVLNKHNLK